MTLKQIAHRGSGALIGLVILAIALSGLAIREISFGGPLQRANQLQSDLVADILPPPEYIIEPFMETTVMVEDQSLPGHVEALATLRKAYEERKAYWHTADISDVLKAQLAVTNKSADAFWADADALVSAAQSGDWVGAKQIHDTRVTPAYTAHKADILKLVALADQEKQALDKRSSWLLYLCFGVLSVSAGVIIAGLILGAKYLRTRVIMPIDATADEMRQMAAGNYNITISGDGRADEIGLMAHAMKTFRAAGIAKAEADAKQQHVVLELGEGLEQLLHLRGGDVAQGHHARLEAAGVRRRAHPRGDHAVRQRLVRRHDAVAAVAVDHPRVVPPEDHLQHRQRLGRAHGLGRGVGDGALHARRDGVVLPEHVAEDRLDHGVQRLAFEIEARLAAVAFRLPSDCSVSGLGFERHEDASK